MRNNVNVTPSSCTGEYSAAYGNFFMAVGLPARASTSSRFSLQSWRRARRTPRRPCLARSAASTTGDTFIAADHALSGKNGPGTQKCFATESETAKAASAVVRHRFRAQADLDDRRTHGCAGVITHPLSYCLRYGRSTPAVISAGRCIVFGNQRVARGIMGRRGAMALGSPLR